MKADPKVAPEDELVEYEDVDNPEEQKETTGNNTVKQ